MMRRWRTVTAVFATLLLTMCMMGGALADEHHARVALEPVDNSGVSGFVQIEQIPSGGSNIHVNANGLQSGNQYVSLYYDNSTCTLPGDLLGTYTANASGTGTTKGKIDDDLDEVDSVSVRTAGDLTLLACASVHP